MQKKVTGDRKIIYSAINKTAESYHYAPLDGEIGGKLFHKNMALMSLSYLLDKNHLLLGEPGWGKTTSAKIIVAKYSGLPYDLYDSLEIRGNPQKYEEKIVARPNYAKLTQGTEAIIWQGTFGLNAIIIDEVNRLPYETQDVILQGIDTGRWNYQNESLCEGKKPTFMTMNEREGENGLYPALNDRIDIVTEEKYFSTLPVFDFGAAKQRVEKELCDPRHTQKVLDALKTGGFSGFKDQLQVKILKDYLTNEQKQAMREAILGTDVDNDAWLFLQSFMAEINSSSKYGCKRSTDPISNDTHDLQFVGVYVKHSFSPRSAMAAIEYAKGLAWFLEDEKVCLDHVKFILPYIYAHKARFTDDFKNKTGNASREDFESLACAKALVEEAYKNYTKCVQPAKNLIAKIQKEELSKQEISKLNKKEYDHPLLQDMIRQTQEGEKKAFYDESKGKE